MAKKLKKKKVVKKKRVVKAKRKTKPKAAKKTAKIKPQKKIDAQIVGKVTHYFPHVQAGVIKITKGEISVGDKLYIKGHTTDFKQKVASMQIDHVPVQDANKGDEIGLLVDKRVRDGDTVYKL